MSRFCMAVLLALACAASAHDIPNDVTVQVFFKPEPQRLRLIVRAPLKAMRDIVFPERGPGYLDLTRVDPLLPDAATLWISDSLEIHENDAVLPKPAVVETR